LLQFPFSFHNTPENLTRLARILTDFGQYPLVVEVRHSSWTQPEFFHFLHEHHAESATSISRSSDARSSRANAPPPRSATSACTAAATTPGSATTPSFPATSATTTSTAKKSSGPWAQRIRHVAAHADNTFVVTNNHYEGKGVVNALQLIQLLSGDKVKVPETLRHRHPQLESIADAPPQEPTLFPLPPP